MEITPTILLQWNILLKAFGHVDGIWLIKFAQTLFQAKALYHSDSSGCISAHPKTKYLVNGDQRGPVDVLRADQ